jgi:hypothetical protein
MTTSDLSLPFATPSRVPRAVRAAQLVMVGPLGLLVGVAATAFTASSLSTMAPWEFAISAWAIALAVVNVTAGLRLGRGSAAARRALLVSIGAQIAFGVVKLTVYHESASFVFAALDAVALVLLTRPSVRRFAKR